MNPQSMEPFGRALSAYHQGDTDALLWIIRDDGKKSALPIFIFFRDEEAFTELEKKAMTLSRGRVLDIGVGAGSHSVVLQRKGCQVTGLDIDPEAAAVAEKRGVERVVVADVMTFSGGPFDTLLMMGHGIGMVETIEGLRRFLARAHQLLAADGQLLLDSLDVRITDEADNLAYHEINRQAGKYIGEIRMQFEFRDETGPLCGWLQVDSETLSAQAELSGWQCQIVYQGEDGNYLARLTKALDKHTVS